MSIIQRSIFLVWISSTVVFCGSNNDTQDEKGTNKISDEHLLSEKELIPYLDVYKFDAPMDTILPNGAFLKHFVNRDTLDKNIYLKYGNKSFDSLLVIEDWLELSPCHNYQVCYSTPKSIGIIYACMNSRNLQILPLERTRPVITGLNPLFIGVKEEITISFIEGNGHLENADSLVIADLDFKKKQYIKVKRLACSDKILCFEDVKVKENKLYLTYSVSDLNSEAVTETQVEHIELK